MTTHDEHALASSALAGSRMPSAADEDLLRQLHEQYLGVTVRQLERWRSQDCLPRNDQRHTIGVRGSSSAYPSHTLAQALAICHWHAKEPHMSFDELRVLLWMQGFPIPLQRVQASIQHLLGRVRDALGKRTPPHVRDPLTIAERLTHDAMPQLERSTLGRHLKRTLPSADMASFLTTLFQLVAGARPAFEAVEDFVAAGDEVRQERSLADILIAALGLERAQTDSFGDARPWLPGDITATLVRLAQQHALSLRFLLKCVAQATPQQLAQARTDCQAMLTLLPQLTSVAESLFGLNAFGLGAFRLLEGSKFAEDAGLHAWMIAGLLGARRLDYSAGLDQVTQSLRDALTPIETQRTVLAVMERELPDYIAEVAPYLAPTATESGNLTPHYQARLSRLRELAEGHREELRAFRGRHPALFPDEPSDAAGDAPPSV